MNDSDFEHGTQISYSRDIVHSLVQLLREHAPGGWEISRYVQNMDSLTAFNARGKVFINEVTRERANAVGDRVTVNVNFFTGAPDDTDDLYGEMAYMCSILSSRTAYKCGIYYIPSGEVSGPTRVENSYVGGSQWLCTIVFHVTRRIITVG